MRHAELYSVAARWELKGVSLVWKCPVEITCVCRSEETPVLYSYQGNKKFQKIRIPGSFAPLETMHMSISPGFEVPVSHFMSVRLRKSDSSHRSVCIEFPRRSFLIFLPLIAILEC